MNCALSKPLFKADLHCHTTFSDGTLSPEQLLELAAKSALSGIAITDHDTIEGLAPAIVAAKKMGIALGSGVEISTLHLGRSVHLLGYDFQIDNSDLIAYLALHKKSRTSRNFKMAEKLKALGMPIDFDKLSEMESQKGSTGRPHIAQLMIEKGYVSSVQQAFNLYLAEGCSCFDSGRDFPFQEAIEIIHGSAGKAFLAHPHIFRERTFAYKLLDYLRAGCDGVECYYGTSAQHVERSWEEQAKRRGLLISGGSDFHGAGKEYIRLGCRFVNETVFNQIFEKPLA